MKRLLVIAGSDSSAGAGLQADLKTAHAFGVYAQTAVTAVTVQNTLGVAASHMVPPDIVREQIAATLSDIGADAIKTGMLGSAEMAATVADALAAYARGVPLVVDPVMAAKGGAALLDDEAVAALKARLLPMAALVTPNLPEAERLFGFAPRMPEDTWRVEAAMRDLHIRALLLKGGHGEDADAVTDWLFVPEGVISRTMPRQKTQHTHGTGCTLASAIACGLAEGLPLAEAVRRAQDYVQDAIRAAPRLGRGHGPLNHSPH